MIDFDKGRRRFVNAAGMVGAGLMLAGTNSRVVRAAEKHDEDSEKEVGAVEDLMREHGVIRRAILVYRGSRAVKLRAKPSDVDPDILRRTALLFRNFGEDYHEKKLGRDAYLPDDQEGRRAGGGLVDILVAQHQRGREITDYVLAVTAKGAIGTGDAEPLARALDSVELMYEHHAAREDTIVFPGVGKTRFRPINSVRWARSSKKSNIRQFGQGRV